MHQRLTRDNQVRSDLLTILMYEPELRDYLEAMVTSKEHKDSMFDCMSIYVDGCASELIDHCSWFHVSFSNYIRHDKSMIYALK